MRRFLPVIRHDERRDAWAAFVTLFGFVASHSVLETARDALFLAKVPAAELPWVYLGIAAVSLVLARAQLRLSSILSARATLCAWTLTVAVVTIGFWALLDRMRSAGLYALYIWSGVLASLVLAHFWVLLGDLFTMTQAKRLYGFIGLGGVIGAIAGSGTASAISSGQPASRLVLVAAGGFAVTSALPLLFRTPGTRAARSQAHAASSVLEDLRYVGRSSYARWLALLIVASAACLTVADYVFKAAVADAIPHEQLGAWLGSVYLMLNVLSLVSQLVIVGWLLRRFGVTTALAILPALVLGGGVALVAGGALVAALAIKGADGALRYSVHRTATELLVVPLSDEARRRMKSFVDVVGQRGGQAIASLALLAAAAIVAPPRVVAILLVLLAAAWLVFAIAVRRPYVDMFRSYLHGTRGYKSASFPALDVASLETLVATLDSSNDAEVVAALDVLERESRARLVPTLILYHPSERVVIQALGLFARSARMTAVPAIDRLLEHASPRVRSAAIAARATLALDPKLLNLRLSLEDSAEVRATIVLHLIAAGEIAGAEATERIDRLIHSASAAARIAMAEAAAGPYGTSRLFHRILNELARAREPEVRLAAASAMARLRAPDLIDGLIGLLEGERTRSVARAALVAHGDAACDALVATLSNEARAPEVRWHIPQLLVSFDPDRAAPALLERLSNDRSGMVRYRSLLALERLVSQSPGVRLDPAKLESAIEETISRAYRYLDRCRVLDAGVAADPRRATPGHELLVRMLGDKQRESVGRLLRLLALAFPREDFAGIRQGATGTDKTARANAIELLENILDPPVRQAVVGLLDDAPHVERLGSAGRYHEPLRADYESVLDQMLESSSEAVQDLTVFHVAELNLTRFRPRIESLRDADTERRRVDVARALEILGGPQRAPVASTERAC